MMSQAKAFRCGSVRPILDVQAGNFREVLQIPAEQGCVANQSDRGDFQVLRSNARRALRNSSNLIAATSSKSNSTTLA